MAWEEARWPVGSAEAVLVPNIGLVGVHAVPFISAVVSLSMPRLAVDGSTPDRNSGGHGLDDHSAECFRRRWHE